MNEFILMKINEIYEIVIMMQDAVVETLVPDQWN